jgi:hypothetical protein
LFEAGWGHFGPTLTGQNSNSWFYQTGISVGLGSNTGATLAKVARMTRAKNANAAKLKKLNQAIVKANQS